MSKGATKEVLRGAINVLSSDQAPKLLGGRLHRDDARAREGVSMQCLTKNYNYSLSDWMGKLLSKGTQDHVSIYSICSNFGLANLNSDIQVRGTRIQISQVVPLNK